MDVPLLPESGHADSVPSTQIPKTEPAQFPEQTETTTSLPEISEVVALLPEVITKNRLSEDSTKPPEDLRPVEKTNILSEGITPLSRSIVQQSKPTNPFAQRSAVALESVSLRSLVENASHRIVEAKPAIVGSHERIKQAAPMYPSLKEQERVLEPIPMSIAEVKTFYVNSEVQMLEAIVDQFVEVIRL